MVSGQCFLFIWLLLIISLGSQCLLPSDVDDVKFKSVSHQHVDSLAFHDWTGHRIIQVIPIAELQSPSKVTDEISATKCQHALRRNHTQFNLDHK
jgi:hypothetical protein